jgi:deoxyribodipyrimidine photo-lyase
MPEFDKSLVWLRRDLRCFDHAAMHQALRRSGTVYCAFVFDKNILDDLPRADRRVEFIHASVTELDHELRKLGGNLIVRHAHAADEIPLLASELGVDAVFVNHDYEPQAVQRDAEVAARLAADGRVLLGFKDQVIFEKDEILSQSKKPFSVFTPYKNAWLKKLYADIDAHHGDAGGTCLAPFRIEEYVDRLKPFDNGAMLSLADLGFEKTNLSELNIPTGMTGGQALIDDFGPRMGQYGTSRNFPAIKGPSYLSVHLRFGTVSIRGLARRAVDAMRSGENANEGANGAAVWLSELIWRDFYAMILHHHPRVVTDAFKPHYDRIEWETGKLADEHFRAWCEGRTGYPLVDAAMLQLNRTGYMHNRLRMVTACFLIKDLGIDWRRGERYFAERLNDYDLASNNGGWQWAASSGCDAQPYFRIFNPVTQSERFDPDGKFIRRYLPQLGRLANRSIHTPWLASPATLEAAGIDLGENYPQPIVAHDAARVATLARYAVVKIPG